MKKTFLLILIFTAILIASVLIGVKVGYADIPTKEIVDIVLNKVGFNVDISYIKDSTVDIVVLVRLPRVVLAIIVGMALSVSGVVMQAIVRNPLADPYILGISSGASLGATLAILLGIGKSLGGNFVGVAAFVMAFLTSLLVLFLANIGGRANSTKLLLSGMAISTASSSISSLIIYLTPKREAFREVSFWLLGSISGAKWSEITFVGPIIILLSLFFITQYRTLNLMLLGDEVSITIGKDLNIARHLYLLVSSAMIGFVVYVSGVIGFIGLIVPHITRGLVGTDHKKLIPISMLLGSILLVCADFVARILVSGSELPTGVVISVIGAPLFIYLIISRSYKGGAD